MLVFEIARFGEKERRKKEERKRGKRGEERKSCPGRERERKARERVRDRERDRQTERKREWGIVLEVTRPSGVNDDHALFTGNYDLQNM